MRFSISVRLHQLEVVLRTWNGTGVTHTSLWLHRIIDMVSNVDVIKSPNIVPTGFPPSPTANSEKASISE